MQKILITGAYVFKAPVIKGDLVIPAVTGNAQKKLLFRVSVHDPPQLPKKGDYINIFGKIKKISIENNNVVIDIIGDFELGLKTSLPQVVVGITCLQLTTPPKKEGNKYIAKINSKLSLLFSESQVKNLALTGGSLLSVHGAFWVNEHDGSYNATMSVKSAVLLQQTPPTLQEITDDGKEADPKTPLF